MSKLRRAASRGAIQYAKTFRDELAKVRRHIRKGARKSTLPYVGFVLFRSGTVDRGFDKPLDIADSVFDLWQASGVRSPPNFAMYMVAWFRTDVTANLPSGSIESTGKMVRYKATMHITRKPSVFLAGVQAWLSKHRENPTTWLKSFRVYFVAEKGTRGRGKSRNKKKRRPRRRTGV